MEEEGLSLKAAIIPCQGSMFAPNWPGRAIVHEPLWDLRRQNQQMLVRMEKGYLRDMEEQALRLHRMFLLKKHFNWTQLQVYGIKLIFVFFICFCLTAIFIKKKNCLFRTCGALMKTNGPFFEQTKPHWCRQWAYNWYIDWFPTLPGRRLTKHIF